MFCFNSMPCFMYKIFTSKKIESGQTCVYFNFACILNCILMVYYCLKKLLFPIAFDERVTFWVQHVRSLPCAFVHGALFTRRLAFTHLICNHTCIQCSKRTCTKQCLSRQSELKYIRYYLFKSIYLTRAMQMQ